jgi:hypothetical protein
MVNPENRRNLKTLRKDGSGVADDGYHRFGDSESGGHLATWVYLMLTATVTR